MGFLVKTKYKIGDQVWYLYDNRVISTDVTGVRISVDSTGKYSAEYILHYDSSWMEEGRLFESKNELLASL